MANDQLKALRAKALQAERNAGKKISRNRGKGVELAGTEFDPRKGAGRINRMNMKQVEAQLNRVTGFNSRGNQFLAGVKGTPLPRNEFQAYKAAENAYNAKASAENSTFYDIKLPSGMTIGQRHATMKADHPMMGNPSVKVPNEPIVSSPGDFTNVKAVVKLRKDLKSKMTKAYDRKQLKASKAELQKIMAVVKTPELDAKINKLTNRQFNLLWNHSQFATAASLLYEILEAISRGINEPWYAKQLEDSFSQATKLVDWASKQ